MFKIGDSVRIKAEFELGFWPEIVHDVGIVTDIGRFITITFERLYRTVQIKQVAEENEIVLATPVFSSGDFSGWLDVLTPSE